MPLPKRPPHPPPAPPQIGEGDAHNEAAWARRLPAALRWLSSAWWGDAAARHATSLFFTSPPRLQPGQPAVLFVNAARSRPLAGVAALRVKAGFNNWRLPGPDVQLEPAPQVAAAAAAAAGAPLEEHRWQAASFVVPDGAYEMQVRRWTGACACLAAAVPRGHRG